MSTIKTKKELAKQIAANLRHLRKNANLSIDKLLWALGELDCELGVPAYRQYEGGYSCPNLFVLRAVALFYDLTIEQLCFTELHKTK
jgi:hypothetical protein